MDWYTIFAPDVPLLETILRGTVMYLALFAMFRVILKREPGAVGITDLLMVVLVADAAHGALGGNYTSIINGLVLVATIIFWNYVLDWASHRFPWMARMLHPPPLLLIKDGQAIRRNMRREFITEDELMAEVRKVGVEDIQDVKKAFIEGDGHFSVILKDGSDTRKKGERKGPL